MMRSRKLMVLLLVPGSWAAVAGPAPDVPPGGAMADEWRLVGQVASEPGWDLWGASPVRDEAGRVHLFIARWPAAVNWDTGWRKESEIARYVADKPEGPFELAETVVKGDGDGWDAAGMHNPCIRRVGERYALFHIANSWQGGRAKHGPNQRIGLRIADSLEGPWNKAGEDGLILEPAKWCAESGCGVNNPAYVLAPDRRHMLYFKARPGAKGGVRMGVAVAERLEGPYVIQDQPITANDKTIEDGTAFLWGGRICLITTDNHGIVDRGGGLLWVSEDGLRFEAEPRHAFRPLKAYLGGKVPKEAKFHYGRETKFERPQVLLENGRPGWLYAPSGTALRGEDGTGVFLLRWR